MMKFISSIVVFSVTFILSVALVGVPQQTFQYSENSVVELLRQDIRNGEMRRFEVNELFREVETSSVFSVTSYAGYVQEYVDSSQSMNDYDLPADFRNSWRQHMKAWRDYSNFLNRIKRSSDKPTYSEFLEMDKAYTYEINKTWYKTLRIGRHYDSNLDSKIY